MKKLFAVITIILLSTPFFGYAQRDKSVDFGFLIGGSYYIGDLNKKHFDQFTKPAGGLVFRYNLNQRAALRGNFLMGTVEAHDSYSNSQWQKQRNLSFKSPVKELSLQFEFNFLNYKIGGKEDPNFSPYIFFGIAAFHFNPQGQTSNGWTDLQPLGTEGQGLPNGASKTKYSLNQISVPFGIGFRTDFSKGMCVGFEWGIRRTFTDYLDDVSGQYYDPALLEKYRGDNGKLAAAMADPSLNKDPNYSDTGKQRGDPTNKDWYSFFGIVLTMKLIKTESCTNSLKMGGG